ncbi:MAG: nitrate reductase [Thiomargarita sp.]|nr:nitrate reductase [Thiomargarita sp.]
MSSTQTTCPYCGVGCGVIAQISENGMVTIQGDKSHPANLGKLCSKGIALNSTLSLENRLLQPIVAGESCSWDTALDKVANKLQHIIAEHGSNAIAFYVSGQLLTEDYYIANKLMKGFIGSANIDTNSRLCMSSSVSGYKRAFGSDTVPGNYTDIEAADLIVLAGSNLAWCHPILFQRIVAIKEKRPNLQIVVIDPRYTATCEIADLHLPLKSGSDIWLFNGLLDFLRKNDKLNYDFLEKCTQGLASALHTARESSGSIFNIANHCGLEEEEITKFFNLFANTEKVVTLYSQGINQSTSGTDKVNSIINCHLATGRLGKAGMGPFSMTGQPNAMGGREVGALSNQLACHMDFEPDSRALVQQFWKSPQIPAEPGLKVVEMFEKMLQGKIKAIWIMATNPIVSLPNSEQVEKALEKCELVIISDCVRNNDTIKYADVLLPALAWGEKNGTVTNSERRISRQRPFLNSPGEAKADWWIMSQVAQRMGYIKEFSYTSPTNIFREYAALSGYKNLGSRDFDLSGLLPLADEEYQTLSPVQWPICDSTENCAGLRGTERMFTDGRFFTYNGKANFIATVPRLPALLTNVKFPTILNTGRIRDQWHTMTRTGKSARLLRHIGESYVEIHIDDAKVMNIAPNSLVQVKNNLGIWIGRAKITEQQQMGNVFIPMHFNQQNSSNAKVNNLVAANTDPISGQPEFKYNPVRISPYHSEWQAFILSKSPLELPTENIDYWVKIPSDNCWRYELAGQTQPKNWADWIHKNFDENLDWLEYQDRANGRYNCANIIDGRLNICMFVSNNEQLPARRKLIQLFTRDNLTPTERLGLLTAYNDEITDNAICACFNLGENELGKIITEEKLQTTIQIADKCRAGSNCGSCIPELKALLKKQ